VARHHTGTASQLVPSAGSLVRAAAVVTEETRWEAAMRRRTRGISRGATLPSGVVTGSNVRDPPNAIRLPCETSLVYRRLSTRDSALPPPPLAGHLHQMRRRRSPTSEPLHTCGNGIRLRPSRVVCVVDQGRAVVAADRMPPSLAPVTGRHGGLQARAVSNT
jgi:hypothetical protein